MKKIKILSLLMLISLTSCGGQINNSNESIYEKEIEKNERLKIYYMNSEYATYSLSYESPIVTSIKVIDYRNGYFTVRLYNGDKNNTYDTYRSFNNNYSYSIIIQLDTGINL